MGSCRRLALGTLVVTVVAVAYLMDSLGVSIDSRDPWTLRAILTTIRFNDLIDPVLRTICGQDCRITIARTAFRYALIEEIKGIQTSDLDFDGVPVRLFVPEGGANTSAGIVFIHGGGWTLGSVDSHSGSCGWLSLNTGMTAISINYRLAPEHPYPVAFLDCEVATRYFLNNARQFGVDPARVAVVGDSSGGNLAAAVSLRLRDAKFTPALKMAVLIYPALQAIDFKLPSYVDDSSAVLSRQRMVSFWLYYAIGNDDANRQVQDNNHTPASIKRKYANLINTAHIPKNIVRNSATPSVHDGDHALWDKLGHFLEDPYFSPGVALDLRNLPMTLVMTMGSDPLRDDGIIYAGRLRKAGNRLTHAHYSSGFHGLFDLDISEDCLMVRQYVARYITENL